MSGERWSCRCKTPTNALWYVNSPGNSKPPRLIWNSGPLHPRSMNYKWLMNGTRWAVVLWFRFRASSVKEELQWGKEIEKRSVQIWLETFPKEGGECFPGDFWIPSSPLQMLFRSCVCVHYISCGRAKTFSGKYVIPQETSSLKTDCQDRMFSHTHTHTRASGPFGCVLQQHTVWIQCRILTCFKSSITFLLWPPCFYPSLGFSLNFMTTAVNIHGTRWCCWRVFRVFSCHLI